MTSSSSAWIRILVAAALCAAPAPAALAQSPAAAAAQTSKAAADAGPDTGTQAPPPITPIPGQDIPARAESLSSHLRVFRGRLSSPGEVPEIAREFIDFEKELLAKASELAEQTERELPMRVLEERAELWARNAARLASWSMPVRRRVEELLRIQGDLATSRATWEETRKSFSDKQLFPALHDRIEASLRAIEEVEKPLKEQLQSVLTLQNLLATYSAEVEEFRAELSADISDATRRLVRGEMPPIWALRGTMQQPLLANLQEVLSARVQEARAYANDRRLVIVFHVASLIVLLVVLSLLRRMPIRPAGEDPGLAVASHILSRPISTALAIGLLPLGVIYPHAPLMFVEILMFVTLVPFLRLLPRMIPGEIRGGVYWLAVLFILFRIERLALGASLTYRLVLFAASLAGLLGIVLWRRSQRRVPGVRVGRFRRWASFASLILMSAAVIANVAGAVSLAALLASGTITSLYIISVLFAAGRALDAVLAAAGQSPMGSSLAFLRRHHDQVTVWRGRAIGIPLIVIGVVAVLTTFRLWEPLKAGATAALQHQWSLGSLEFTLGGILTFCLIIVAAVLISRFTRFAVEEDVLPRMDLPRGVPGAISMLIGYAIIGVGILTAVSAAGLELSRLTLIAGALSLGIGFGLQGLVNNFVSGLILIFERPFSIGDTVQFGSVTGEVRGIGIRSCIVRTPEGAEVIVPNGSLLSGELINWTLSDRQRRIEVKVGVAYGTDPQRVMSLLQDAARSVENVAESPGPQVLFTGFGDSALDFVVRAWTCGDVQWPSVASDLTVAVNRALADAGIEIPFPQRDVHLKGDVSPAAGS